MVLRPFYQYVQKYRNSSAQHPTAVEELAELIYLDGDFPKSSTEFHQLSDYIELNSRYSHFVGTFDDVWKAYLNND